MTSGRPPAAPIAACASAAEARAARRAGFPTVLVGIGAARGVPDGRLVSFGVAGGLNGLEVGTVIDATRVVAEDGSVLWEGPGLGIPGARTGTIVALDRIADTPEERCRLHERTGAVAVDMESGVLARSGRLDGCVRGLSDTPDRPLGPLARAVDPFGRPRPAELVKALVLHPAATARALAGIWIALRSLSSARRPEGAAST
jgi:hypothetical protein